MPPVTVRIPIVLDRKTLVLNRSWTPITLTTVRRAVVLLAAGAARVVRPATYEVADWDGWLACGPLAAGAVKANENPHFLVYGDDSRDWTSYL